MNMRMIIQISETLLNEVS